MDETNFRLADGRNFGYIVVPVDEINFRLTVRRKLLIRPVSHPLSEFPLSPVLTRHSLSLAAAWVVGSRAQRQPGPRCAGGRAAAGRGGRSGRPWPGAAAGRGRPRLPGEAGGGRAPARGRPCAAAGRGQRAALAAAGSGPRCATLQASRSRPAAGAERWSTARQEQPPKVKKNYSIVSLVL